jgi:hypothetical protein
MLWNRNDLLRFKFLLWKSFGSGSGFGSGSSFGPDLFSTIFQQQKNSAFSMLEQEAVLFPRKLVSNL